MVSMVFCGIFASRRASLYPNQHISFCNWEVIYPLLFFAVVFGMRYDVGVDHLDYLYYYLTKSGMGRFDPIFKWITLFCRNNNLHFTFYFAIFAFIQVFLLFYTFKNERYLFPFLAFVLFTGQYFYHWMNVIRQDTAACIFLFASRYIAEKKFWKYFLCCLIACGFHKTALLLFPVYPLLRGGRDFFKNIPLQLGILFIVSVVAILKFDILRIFGPSIEQFAVLLDYERYTEDVLYRFTDKTKSGVALYCFIVIDIIIILYNIKMKDYFKNAAFKVFYNLYYFGTVTQILCTNNLVLARPFRYFRYFMLIVSAHLLYYLYKHAKPSINTIVFFVLVFLFFILFAAIIKNEPFTFFWQITNILSKI